MQPEVLIQEAMRLGIRKLAVTEINNTTSYIELIRLAESINKADTTKEVLQPIEIIPGIEFREDGKLCYIALAQNRVDAVFNTVPTLAMVLKDAPGKYSMVQGIGADNWAGIAARTEDAEIIRFIDSELARLKADDSLYKLQEKWFGFRMKLAEAIPSFGG